MKIGYFADGRWAHLALERILENRDLEVAFIVPRYSSQDPVLREKAARIGVPFLPHPNVNSPEFLRMISQYKADLFVSMSFNQIFKSEIINLTTKGLINCHAGALPYYRGCNVLNWALINGEKKFGVTVHYVSEEIDAGDIILQRFDEITADEDYQTLYDKAVALCANTLHEALVMISRDAISRKEQREIHDLGFYCTRRKPGDEWLDWSWSSERIHNFTRGITMPGPCARTWLGDRQLAIVKTKLIAGAPAYIDNPGEVLGKTPEGVLIKTGDSSILVTRVCEVDAAGNLSGTPFVPSLRRGVRLVPNMNWRLQDLEARVRRLEELLANPDSRARHEK